MAFKRGLERGRTGQIGACVCVNCPVITWTCTRICTRAQANKHRQTTHKRTHTSANTHTNTRMHTYTHIHTCPVSTAMAINCRHRCTRRQALLSSAGGTRRLARAVRSGPDYVCVYVCVHVSVCICVCVNVCVRGGGGMSARVCMCLCCMHVWVISSVCMTLMCV
jgi:hypothetical protein